LREQRAHRWRTGDRFESRVPHKAFRRVAATRAKSIRCRRAPCGVRPTPVAV